MCRHHYTMCSILWVTPEWVLLERPVREAPVGDNSPCITMQYTAVHSTAPALSARLIGSNKVTSINALLVTIAGMETQLFWGCTDLDSWACDLCPLLMMVSEGPFILWSGLYLMMITDTLDISSSHQTAEVSTELLTSDAGGRGTCSGRGISQSADFGAVTVLGTKLSLSEPT